jgi:hypothetical protein
MAIRLSEVTAAQLRAADVIYATDAGDPSYEELVYGPEGPGAVAPDGAGHTLRVLDVVIGGGDRKAKLDELRRRIGEAKRSPPCTGRGHR